MTDLTPDQLGTPKPQKLFSPRQVASAAFFGSPIAGGIAMSRNFRRSGDEKSAKTTMQLSALGTVLLFILAVYLPENTPNVLLPGIYGALFSYFADKLQASHFSTHIESGGLKESNWRVAGISIVSLICVIAVFLAIAVAVDVTFPGLLPIE